jgi:hypothetical protein
MTATTHHDCSLESLVQKASSLVEATRNESGFLASLARCSVSHLFVAQDQPQTETYRLHLAGAALDLFVERLTAFPVSDKARFLLGMCLVLRQSMRVRCSQRCRDCQQDIQGMLRRSA